MVTVQPLDGVRVLDLTRLLPGAYATLLLADLGADVVKVEDPRGGDGMRSLPTAGRRPYFALLNRNKRSITLDLRSPDAAAVVDALCAKAGVVVDSFRPSTARRLGVDPAALRARHPHLVCASISGFGQSGPYEERAAHDINYQALAGLLRPPELPGPLVGDAGETYDLTNIGTLFAFMLVSIGVLVLRYKEPERPRPFKVPFVWPVCVLSAAGCVFIMYGLPGVAWERFGIWLAIGLVLYFFYGFSHSKLRNASRA